MTVEAFWIVRAVDSNHTTCGTSQKVVAAANTFPTDHPDVQ